MKPRSIAVVNQKGGVGKTTTAVNLAAALSATGHDVLLVDLDPQGHATAHVGISPEKVLDKTVYQVLTGGLEIPSVLVELAVQKKHGRFDLVPSDLDLSGAELELAGAVGRERILADALAGVADRYAFTVIDAPPSFGLLTLNALVAAREVIVPLQTEFYALHGMTRLFKTVEMVKKRLNKRLAVSGIVPTRCDLRRNLDRDVLDQVRGHFKKIVFESVIRPNVALAEAPAHGKTIFDYAPDAPGAEDYRSLTREVVARVDAPRREA
jgi:chromosome partitioning protein